MTGARERGCLTASALKVIAIAAMVVDHLGAFVFPQYLWMRLVGRLTFPIMAFFVYEGWRHTRDVKRYALRLLLFAAVSQVPFSLVSGSPPLALNHLNIGFTLLFGLLAMEFSRRGALGIVGAVVCVVLGDVLWVDYSAYGVLTVLLFYLFARFGLSPLLAVPISCLLMTWGEWSYMLPYIHLTDPSTYRYIPPQMYAIFTVPLLMLYNGERGHAPGWLFYAFYPGHLLLIYFFGPLIRAWWLA